MTEQEFITEYNAICEKHLQLKSTLKDLTDRELYIWIAGKTVHYGRSLEASLENAACHMKDRSKAEKQFGTKKNDDLLGFA